jgi:CRP/FNR family transcriptional regulator
MNMISPMEPFRLSSELKAELIKHGVEKHFETGAMVLNEESYIRSIPIVFKGALKVIRTEDDGREILLYYIKEGESCIMSFLGGLHNDTSKVKVEVEEAADILFLPIQEVALLNKVNPNWLDYIFRMYQQRFEELLDMVNDIAFKKMDERLLSLLQKKANLTQSNEIHVTHEQLSSELGTARVVVSRLLKQMEENGLAKLGRNRITLM